MEARSRKGSKPCHGEKARDEEPLESMVPQALLQDNSPSAFMELRLSLRQSQEGVKLLSILGSYRSLARNGAWLRIGDLTEDRVELKLELGAYHVF